VVGATLQTLPHGWRTVLTRAGLRGAVALAAALSLPLSLPGRHVLLTLTFGLVLFTILAQGLTIRPLLERLGVSGEDGIPRDVELALGRLHTVEATAQGVASPIRTMLTLRSYHGSSVAPTTEVRWLRHIVTVL
jgi:NhaP-type Na+/H+ or K+/H+ antiporter